MISIVVFGDKPVCGLVVLWFNIEGSLLNNWLELQLKPCAQPWLEIFRDEFVATSKSNRAGDVGIVEEAMNA